MFILTAKTCWALNEYWINNKISGIKLVFSLLNYKDDAWSHKHNIHQSIPALWNETELAYLQYLEEYISRKFVATETLTRNVYIMTARNLSIQQRLAPVKSKETGKYMFRDVTRELYKGVLCFEITGRFIMFSMITNIYNKQTKGPTLTFWRLTTTIVVLPHR